MTQLNGILPVLPTPFSDDGGVDLDAMTRLVTFARNADVNGVVFPGFASEVEHLTPDERLSLLQVVVSACDGALPIVAGASAPTAEQVIGHAQAAFDLGIRWVMIQPPIAIGNSTDAVLSFFRPITEALPDMRIVLQNAPAPRGSDLSAETILTVVTELPQIAYVKEETLPAGPSITAILAQKPESLLGVIGGGGARYILDEYQRGACAAMPALEIAAEHVDMDKAWAAGERDMARDLYIQTLPLLTLQAVYRMRLTKHVLMRRGVLQNTIVRAPTPDLDPVAIADIDQNLAELGLMSEAAE